MEYKELASYKPHKKIFFKNAVLFFLVLSLIFTIIYSIVQYSSIKSKRLILNNKETSIVDTEQSIMERYISSVLTDVKYISEDYKVHQNYYGDKSEEELVQEWILFSKNKGIYDQIRFIDKNGMEKLRVDYSNGSPKTVPYNELKYKGDKAYFKAALDINPGEIGISKFDLNMENNIVETPIKPVIRFYTPIYDKANNLSGIIVLNYSPKNLLRDFEKISLNGEGEFFLINSDGYYLINKDKSKEWAFMYPEKKNISFKNDFPEEWKTIFPSEAGQFQSKNGIFTYKDLLPLSLQQSKLVLSEGPFTIISHVSIDSSAGYYNRNALYIIAFSLFKNLYIFAVIAIISIFIAVLITLNKVSREKIRYYADYDVMTGVLNRRAGFNKLEEIFSKVKQDKMIISICFIDINGLKEVNDNLGHDAGDELIKAAVDVITNSIRSTDFVVRLGGDEFLIIFPKTDERTAEDIWDRIKNTLKHINEESKKPYLISLSHGITEFKPETKSYLDDLIKEADEKMYNEKREIKKNLKILRENI